MGSNYGPTIHVQNAANAINLNQVLWLYGEDHQITEVGTMNFFMLFINDNGGECAEWISAPQSNNFIFIYIERELRTPPLNGLILPGITRDSILELTRSWCDFVVTEEQFTMPEVVKLLQENRVCILDHIPLLKHIVYTQLYVTGTRNVWHGHCMRGQSD